ncbi:MAG: 3,4-dihydroxy-2-butanone-4-phosphate synthase [Candidatus Micrarchaeota archaeon]
MLSKAISSLRAGKFIVLYDGERREGEADLVVHGSYAFPKAIFQLRADAGGLICFATSGDMMKRMGLSYMAKILRSSGSTPLRKLAISRTPYGDESAFSISLNHRKTFTGIPDCDRSLTIIELSKMIAKNNGIGGELTKNFYSPGHVPLLFARDIKERKGHTELAVELCKMANLPAAVVVCEMLGIGRSASKGEAKKYAKTKGLAFLEGKDILGELGLMGKRIPRS